MSTLLSTILRCAFFFKCECEKYLHTNNIDILSMSSQYIMVKILSQFDHKSIFASCRQGYVLYVQEVVTLQKKIYYIFALENEVYTIY